MRNRYTAFVVGPLLVGALALSGCSGSKKEAAPPVVSVAKVKAPLAVPATFADEKAKHDFAVKAVVDGYYKEALPLLESLAATNNDADTLAHLGTARYNLKDYAGALESWTKAGELNPKMKVEMQTNIGNALRDSRKLAEAEKAYRAALQMDPTYWQSAVNLAVLLKTDGRLPEAVGVLEQSVKQNGELPPLAGLLTELKHDLSNKEANS